ncbi:MAG: hypothetical protein CSA81_02795 [Acidobacteria bacterium]|nr:MAG: hypothetical protein CSA81_02795 [Acidobacteriota bacterium]
MKTVKLAAGMILLLTVACQQKTIEEEHDPHPETLTSWTEDFEVFSEFTYHPSEGEVEALVCVTRLEDFSPVSDLDIVIALTDEHTGETIHSQPLEYVSRGIYKGFMAVKQTHYALTYHVKEKGQAYQIDAPDSLHLGQHHHGEEDEHGEEEDAGAFSFLKEQQWSVDFQVGLPQWGPVYKSLKAYGQIQPKAGNEIVMTAPVSGVAVAAAWPVAGTYVKKGEPLISMIPAVMQDTSLADLETNVSRLKQQLTILNKRVERMQRLLDSGNISRWEFENELLQRDIIQSELQNAKKNLKTVRSLRKAQKGKQEVVTLTAPFDGAVVHVKVTPKQFIDAGTEMIHIVKPNPVYLNLSVSLKQQALLGGGLKGAYIRSSAQNQPHFVGPDLIQFLSTTPGTNPATGKLSALFELRLDNELLPFKSIVEAELLLETQGEGLLVPASAVIDDAGQDVIYVQLAGESFKRHEVHVLAIQGNRAWVEGIDRQQRIVVQGGYALRRTEMIGSGSFSGHSH